MDGGRLSNLQLECIQLAATRHLSVVPTTPTPTRCGFFLGDGAGVGKGRQLAGIILDQLSRGSKRHVWFSISSDLRTDAERDLHDLGCFVPVHDGCQGLDKSNKGFGLAREAQSGVLFSTYSTLISATSGQKAKGASRLSQLVEWCGGPAFEGCLLFDECHKAKNFSASSDSGSKVAAAVIAFQERCPRARVVYASATGISEVGHMTYLARLGFWGKGTPFKSADTFIESMKSRGVGFLEMLAMEMKASGKYVSRGLSFRQAEFEQYTIALSKEQRQMYDDACDLMSLIRNACIEAVRRTGSDGKGVWSAYWSVHQRFFKLIELGQETVRT